ncbi:MAG: glutamate racemase [Planctomycetes bacterium]|nr:glutamate racemase [Planctomycetota bacterium]
MLVGQPPIAVFDSGLGGLTVVRELRRLLPEEDVVYFGDTARVPFGGKSPETVLRFARETCAFLLRMNPKCIVAACNTVSAVCLRSLVDEIPVPVFGVVQPGVEAALEAAKDGDMIAVIATEATIDSNAYDHAIHAIDPERAVVQTSCPLFVPLVEEGWSPTDSLVRTVIERYLGTLRRLSPGVVVLGCTHYPMLRRSLAEFFGELVTLIDSAGTTAKAVENELRKRKVLSETNERGNLHCYVSDNPKRFESVGSRFLGETIYDVVRVCPEELARATTDTLEPRRQQRVQPGGEECVVPPSDRHG